MNGSQAVLAASSDLTTEPRSTPGLHSISGEAIGLPWAEAPWPMTGYPHEVIDRFCQSDPDRSVIVTTEEVWSRKRLKKTSDAIAHALVTNGVRPGDIVVVVLPKSAMAIAAILGIWKAGAAFVPVDPHHPEARNKHVLSDCGAGFAVSNQKGLVALENTDIKAVLVEDIEAADIEFIAEKLYPDQLAYIIYTSGSTGKPKGVMVDHGPLVDHLNATGPLYLMDETSRELPFLPFSSDGGHERWIVPLMAGGSILLPDQLLWTPEDTVRAVRAHGVTHASFPTSYVHELAGWLREKEQTLDLILCSFGGEAMPRETFNRIARAINSQYLINGYGPTETVMTPMLWRVNRDQLCETVTAPIGRPVGDRWAYILDGDCNRVARGEIGEIHLGGYCIARGYNNLAEKTDNLFVPDSFAQGDNARMYRTGDLGRFLPDGMIQFAGRVDDQVKIRGHRIEPAEIETVLRGFDDVANCVVIAAHVASRLELIAYVVPRSGASVDTRSVRARLQQFLPSSMVPGYIIEMTMLPLNANHKVDKAQLPLPRREGSVTQPQNDGEAAVLAIWKAALGLDDIGVTDNFFEIGGNSITALRVQGKIREHFPNSNTEITDLFNFPTIRSFLQAMSEPECKPGADIVHLQKGNRDAPVLYCFPGLLVSTREYMKLVKSLGPDQSAVGFMCHSLSDSQELDVSVSDISARYAEIVHREAKGRPCAFLGWSWGGLLAYEAARMLGNDIDLRLIGMVDVCDMDDDFDLNARPKFQPGERAEIEIRIRQWLQRTSMREDWERLLALMDDLAYAQFVHFVGKSEFGLPTDGPGIGTREHTFWVLIDNALVFRRHELLPYDAPIASWLAGDTVSRNLDLIDFQSLSRRAERPEHIPGTDHLTIIGDPAFHKFFGGRLTRAFEQTGSLEFSGN
ncbi:amino acid adenylation domain-containing protein [Thalassospira lucentensis]|uniref:amino acid adenylation domain-containing protein n=1 Tax=Thalassospira lucentensis TaxID=168935 RepID=UPI003D2ED61F